MFPTIYEKQENGQKVFLPKMCGKEKLFYVLLSLCHIRNSKLLAIKFLFVTLPHMSIDD